jgi:hypothetical protein
VSKLKSLGIKWWIVLVIILVCAGGLGYAIGVQKPIPLRVVSDYSLETLTNEMYTLNECAECHEPRDYHTCQTCHDDHGAIELDDVPFYAMIEFTGDVPEPGYILIDDILPYTEQPHTHKPLLDFLAEQGVTDFESVTLGSNDGGFITINLEALTANALLLPYEDGIRFASEDLHVSTWLKGINRMIVVGHEKPLMVGEQPTSIGRLLLGPTRSVTVEQTDVMLASELDGKVRKAKTATRLQGSSVVELLPAVAERDLEVRDGFGETHVLNSDEIQGAILLPLRGELTLVLPDRGRSQWITNVVALDVQE